jgi:hypothetical protein
MGEGSFDLDKFFYLRALRIAMLENFRGLHKSSSVFSHSCQMLKIILRAKHVPHRVSGAPLSKSPLSPFAKGE